MFVDYYEILGLNIGSSVDEIKKAFRREAFKWHPDKNSSSEANERMQLINEAYLILKDREARARYDNQYSNFKTATFEETETEVPPSWQDSEYDTVRPSHSNYAKYEYEFDDKILKEWMQNARKQAKEMAKQSLDDLVGMTRAGCLAAWLETRSMIFLMIIVLVIYFIVFAG